jgi:hypothetical protein
MSSKSAGRSGDRTCTRPAAYFVQAYQTLMPLLWGTVLRAKDCVPKTDKSRIVRVLAAQDDVCQAGIVVRDIVFANTVD